MHDDSLDKAIHSLLNFSTSMQHRLVDVASPLTELFDSTYFYYIKYFLNTGKRLILSTRVDCLQHFLSENQLSLMKPIFPSVVEELFRTNYKFYLWTGSPSESTHQAFYQHDIWNGCTHYTKSNEIIEACGVATKRENEQIVNKYVNNLDIFLRFMLYFKENCSDLINKPDNSILLPSNFSAPSVIPQNNHDEVFSNFLKKTQIKNYPIHGESGCTLITRREAEVMFYLSKGKSAKEIAVQLSISPRTVETYLENIKLKLCCNTRSRAIELFLNCYGHNSKIPFIV